MPTSAAAMQVALRVLAAISRYRDPPAADVEELRRITPGFKDLPPDELACQVVQFGVRARQKAP